VLPPAIVISPPLLSKLEPVTIVIKPPPELSVSDATKISPPLVVKVIEGALVRLEIFLSANNFIKLPEPVDCICVKPEFHIYIFGCCYSNISRSSNIFIKIN
jgi:hypothetical protein